MYLQLIILIILILPIPLMATSIGDKIEPFKVISKGLIAAGIGVLAVFLWAYASGDSIGKNIESVIDKAVDIIVGNKQAMETLGLENVSEDKAISILKEAYKTAAEVLPSILFTIGAITTYIEYNILVRIKYRRIDSLRPTAYMRNFTLKKENVIGWFIIYLGAYIFEFAGLEMATVAVANISAIVQFIISLQGMSVVFLLFYKRRFPSLLAGILIMLFWITPTGKTVLFTVGVIDLLINLRARVAQA